MSDGTHVATTKGSATWDFVASIFLVAVAATAWIVGALLVAFPGLWMHFRLGQLFNEFFADLWHPISLYVLLFADVIIAMGLLSDRHLTVTLAGRRLAVWLFFSVAYLLAGYLVPKYATQSVLVHPVVVGLLTLAVFAIPRGMAYAPPRIARSFPSSQ